MLCLSRPAILLSDESRLDEEYRAARWCHNRLLDFEDEHQRLLDKTANEIAPGIVSAGRIVAKLARRARRRQRTTAGQWSPDPRPDLAERVKRHLTELKKVRDADPRWKAALRWDREQIGDAKQPRRKRGESDEDFAARFAQQRRRDRRETFKTEIVYKQRRCYWGTFNAVVKRVEQARADVLKRRAQGLPAEWHRPRWRDSYTIAADKGFRVVERGDLWWVIEMRVGVAKEWVRFKAKCGNWHRVPENAVIKLVQLTRYRDGARWRYRVSLAIEGVAKNREQWAARGTVGIDWGHREHGHDAAREGIRAFTWVGDDGAQGEILVPAICRKMQDEIDAMKERLDETFNARKRQLGLSDRNRHTYRRRLLAQGARTKEEDRWLRWETKYERRIQKRRNRIADIRAEAYLNGWTDSRGERYLGVRELRKRYLTFAIEDQRIHDSQGGPSMRTLQMDEPMMRRKRANRDLTARYDFVSLCERFGAVVKTVSARDTTRECPGCGHLAESTKELMIACGACGQVRDRDYGAAKVILRRALGPLENQAAE